MTTINTDKLIQSISAPKSATGPAKTEKTEFGEVFQQALGSTTKTPADIQATAHASDVRPARFSVESAPSAGKVVDKVQRLIDTLADYQGKLIEKGTTLKEMDGLVRQMETQSASLAAASDQVGESGKLKAIVNQSLMLSAMEIAKYNNGHYND
jgi:hypothetical protein